MYKKTRKAYLNNEISLKSWQKFGVFCLVISLSGIFGWIYEFILYFFDGGMKDLFLQGGNFLPWINIYAIGAVAVAILTRKIKNRPFLVFLVATVVTGAIEYVSAWLIYTLGNGARYWDYNVEILNFGNINGFICLRSVLFFGLSSLFLIYFMLPFSIYLSKKMKKRTFLILSISLFSLIIADEIYNLLATYFLNLPSAVDLYKSAGFKYVEFNK